MSDAQVQDEGFVMRMSALLKGEVAPPDETIGYLLQAYKKDSQELLGMQEAIIKLRGRLESREADLKHWDAENQKKINGTDSADAPSSIL